MVKRIVAVSQFH